MLNRFDNFIFDLDGTIVDSSDEVLRCFKEAFQLSGCSIDENRFTSDVIGPPLKEIIENLFPELDSEEKLFEITSNFRQIYDYDDGDISSTYKGIVDVLKELKKQGKRLFMATLKPTIPTIRLIEKFELNGIFEDIYTIDKFGKNISKKEMIDDAIQKHNLNKAKTVMIGDAPSDVISAKLSDITGIGVLWGYGSDKSDLIKNSDYVINSPEELLCQK